jgi:hypothetical protein
MDNFLPNVQCPHCGKWTVSSISGFGGMLSIRGGKICRQCNKPFNITVLSVATKEGEITEDGAIRNMKERLKTLKKMRNENAWILSMKVRLAQQIVAEADEMAEKMAEERSKNAKLN